MIALGVVERLPACPEANYPEGPTERNPETQSGSGNWEDGSSGTPTLLPNNNCRRFKQN